MNFSTLQVLVSSRRTDKEEVEDSDGHGKTSADVVTLLLAGSLSTHTTMRMYTIGPRPSQQETTRPPSSTARHRGAARRLGPPPGGQSTRRDFDELAAAASVW